MSRILIVDDEKSIRRTLGEFLREDGHVVVEAEDADIALQQLSQSEFDLVVTDIILPRVNGVELLRRIHATAPDAQVVMMTGEPTVETASESLRAGAVDYLFKPITKAAIQRAAASAGRLKALEDAKRRLEAENRAHRENLERLVEERTAQLRTLARAVDQSPVSIIITDRAGNIEFVNPKFTQLTGYTVEEVLGKNPRFLKSGETAAEEYRQLWETLMAGKEWRGEFHNRRKDGALYWETASISAVRDAFGEITHFIAVKEDVTEKKLTNSKLLRAQRVESIGCLASGIAHDLNNILSPIVMSAPLLQMDDSPQTRREVAQIIESSANRAVSIVKQLLSFARGREGQKVSLQVHHLIRDMAKIARETFPRDIQVEVSCAPDLWPVLADATQLHQVLLNLCVNARDAMPSGGKLTLCADNVTLDDYYVAMHKEAASGPHLRIQVEDTGEGMTESVQQHIFESFFTTKGEGLGTGLGLTTVQGIVKDHKGFITFTTAPGKGTTFEIHLPAAPGTQLRAEQAPPHKAIPHGRGELVLVVDDEPDICDMTRRTLEQHGYAVLLAQDGVEALAQFSARQAEVRAVVTDVFMPLMDGVTFCRALRALAPRTPIIVSGGGLFGKTGGHALQAFEELGIRNILHKPHNADVLLQALADVLQPSAAAVLVNLPS